MKWKAKRYALSLTKTELRHTRAALNFAQACSNPDFTGRYGAAETLAQINSWLNPACRRWNELSVRAKLIAIRTVGSNRAKMKTAIESGEAREWRNCGTKTLAELSAWCGAKENE